MYSLSDPPKFNVSGEFLDPKRAAELASIKLAAESELHNDKMVQQLHYMVGVYSKGRDYTNFIIAAGYAAYIALWTGVAKDLDAAARLLSGGLLAVSLLSFLAWEITKMVGLMNDGHRIAVALQTGTTRKDLADAVQAALDEEEVQSVLFDNLWPLSFYTSLFTGLVGAAILAIAALAEGAYLAMN